MGGFSKRRYHKFKNLPKKRQRALAALMVIVTIFFGTGLYLLLPNIFKQNVEAAWFDEAWSYRKPLTITNNGSVGSNQVAIYIDTQSLISGSKLQSDCDDLRFTDTNGQLLSYFLEYCSNTSGKNSIAWVSVANLATSATIYMYYGNTTAVAGSRFNGNPTGIDYGDGGDGAIFVSGTKDINADDMISGRTCSDTTGGDAVVYSVTENISKGQNIVNLSTTPNGSNTCLSVGDEILIINQQGTSSDASNGVTYYETARITAISGVTLTLNHPLDNAFGYKGSTNKVQLQRVPNYTNLTVCTSNGVPSVSCTSAGTLTSTAWDGTKGGVVAFRANGTLNVAASGTITVKSNGFRGGSAAASGAFGGGNGEAWEGTNGQGSDGTTDNAASGGGRSGDNATSAVTGGLRSGGGGGGSDGSANTNGGGGGGGGGGNQFGGGGGGGNGDSASNVNGGAGGAAGSTSVNGGGGGGSTGGGAGAGAAGGAANAPGTTSTGTGGAVGGVGGLRSGGGGGGGNSTTASGAGGGGGGSLQISLTNANLTTSLSMGGGGGGGGGKVSGGNGAGTAGSDGGGIIFAAAATLTVAGSISANGDDGTQGASRTGSGGAGAGGSIYLQGSAVTLGTSLVSAAGGALAANGTFIAGGGAGGDGYALVKYSTLSGSIANPNNATTTATPVSGSLGSEESVTRLLPQLYWKLNEGIDNTCSGGTNDACDSTANANDGALTAATWQTDDQCIQGKCLYFNGTSAKVTGSKAATSIKTVSFWIRPNTTASQGIIDLNDASSRKINTNASSQITASGFTSPSIYINGVACTVSSGACTSVTLTANRWYFVEITTGSGVDTGTALTVGTDGTNFTKGFFDEIKLYTSQRTAAQVLTDYNARATAIGDSQVLGASTPPGQTLSNGLVGYWKMDESSWNGTSNEVVDSSGNGNHGTATTYSGSFTHVANGCASSCSTTGTSLTMTLTTATTRNNLVVLGIAMADKTVSSVTDSASNTYYKSAGPASNGSIVQQWYAVQETGGATTVTINISGGSTTLQGFVDEFSGGRINQSNILGTTSTGTGSGTSFSVSSFSPTATGNLIVAQEGNGNNNETFTAGTNYTLGSAQAARSTAEYRLSSTTSETAPLSGTTSVSWAEVAAEYKVKSSTNTDIGEFGNGGDFNGSNDKITVANTISGVQSLSFWIKPASTTGGLIDLNGSAYITASSGTISTTGLTNASIYVNGVSSSTLTANVWQQVIITFTNSISASAIVLGQANGSFFNGSLDEVRFYNRTLISSDISQLYVFAPGPIGYWDFENASGTSVSDKSGNGNTGTWNGTGTSHWASGKYGQAGNFNGSDDYVSIGNPAAVQITGNISVSAWVKLNTVASESKIVGKWTDTTNYNFLLTVSSAKATFAVSNDGGLTTYTTVAGATSLSANTWYHIEGTYDGANLKIYLNGSLDATQSKTGYIFSDSTSLAIGASAGSSPVNFANGVIDDVKIYSYARTAGEIVADMNGNHPAPGSPIGTPIGYWKFNEGVDNTCSGGTNDVCNSGSGGNSEDGSESLMASPGTSTSGWTNSGKFGKALNFDGSDDVINAGSATAIDNLTANPMTLSAWIYPLSMGESSQGVIFSKNSGSTPSSGWLWQFAGTNALKFSVDGSTDLVRTTSDNVITLNAWNHVALSWDGTFTDASTVHVYVNGVEVGYQTTTNGASRVSDASSSMGLGNDSLTASTFNGTLDELKVYNQALTADQIKIDMNQSSGTVYGASSDKSTYQVQAANQEFCIPGDSTSCAAPVARWEMEEKTGTTAFDTSGNANNGTITAGTGGYVNGKVGAAYSFDAADTSINAGSATALDNLPAAGMTLEAWIYPKGAGENSTGFIMAKNVGVSANAGWIFAITSTTALAFTVDGSTDLTVITNTSLITQNAWNHVALSWDGVITTASSAHLYINGKEASYGTQTNGASRVADGTSTFFIGNDSTSARTFDGLIDNARVFNYARTAAQIAWDYNRGGPTAWYKFNECSGATAFDSSGFGNNGTITPSSGTYTSTGDCNTSSSSSMWYNGATGKMNASLAFDGSDDKAVTGNFSPIAANGITTTKISWGGWFYPTQTASQTLIEKASEFQLINNSSNQVQCGVYYSAAFHNTTAAAATALTSNAWNHVMCVYDGSNINVYINGVKVATGSETNSVAATTSTALYMGETSGAANFFKGQIDDVRIFNYALTGTQVKTVMLNGAVRYGPSTGIP